MCLSETCTFFSSGNGMNSGKLIQSKVQQTSAELQSLFNGETESAADRIRRLQIMSDINYGIDKNVSGVWNRAQSVDD